MPHIWFIDICCGSGANCKATPTTMGEARRPVVRVLGRNWKECEDQAQLAGWLLVKHAQLSLCPACVDYYIGEHI